MRHISTNASRHNERKTIQASTVDNKIIRFLATNVYEPYDLKQNIGDDISVFLSTAQQNGFKFSGTYTLGQTIVFVFQTH